MEGTGALLAGCNPDIVVVHEPDDLLTDEITPILIAPLARAAEVRGDRYGASFAICQAQRPNPVGIFFTFCEDHLSGDDQLMESVQWAFFDPLKSSLP